MGTAYIINRRYKVFEIVHGLLREPELSPGTKTFDIHDSVEDAEDNILNEAAAMDDYIILPITCVVMV